MVCSENPSSGFQIDVLEIQLILFWENFLDWKKKSFSLHMCWISPLEPCPKKFGFPKMKLDFQSIHLDVRYPKKILTKLNKIITIGSLCDHCSLLKMQQFCSSAYIEQFGNPVLSSMGAIMNPFDLLLGGLAHGLHFCECLSIIVPHQFPSSLYSCSTICHVREHEFYFSGEGFHVFTG